MTIFLRFIADIPLDAHAQVRAFQEIVYLASDAGGHAIRFF